MATLKRYISYSPLTIEVSNGESSVLLPFSGRNPNGGFFFETTDPEWQKHIEASPFYKKMFNCEAPQKVSDSHKPVTKAPVFPSKKVLAEPVNIPVKANTSVYQPLLDEVLKLYPDATVENYQEKACELIASINDGLGDKDDEETPSPDPNEEETPQGESEQPSPSTGLPEKKVKTLAAAKKWLAEMGVVCSPKTNTEKAIELAKEKGFDLVVDKNLEE
ncbi:hypothetical protein [Draconibacterium mangrovi]|uniref:hypothetical protein n=1 Tax=Draconibacterium mangrovi TaxID=2697469 RepID=UPI0013D17232|nr:hypothetical protein [Draconibacterium mangrovi]